MNRVAAKVVIVVAAMSISAVSAAADKAAVYMNGNSLYAWCLSASRSQQGLCDGYILGIADAMEESKTIAGFAACIPAQVRTRSWAQILNVVKRFLASHPEKRPLSATELIAQAFQEAFPCH